MAKAYKDEKRSGTKSEYTCPRCDGTFDSTNWKQIEVLRDPEPVDNDHYEEYNNHCDYSYYMPGTGTLVKRWRCGEGCFNDETGEEPDIQTIEIEAWVCGECDTVYDDPEDDNEHYAVSCCT